MNIARRMIGIAVLFTLGMLVCFIVVLLVSLVWMSRTIMDATDSGLNTLENYYTTAGFAAETDVFFSRYT